MFKRLADMFKRLAGVFKRLAGVFKRLADMFKRLEMFADRLEMDLNCLEISAYQKPEGSSTLVRFNKANQLQNLLIVKNEIITFAAIILNMNRKNFTKRLLNYFLQGLLFISPIAITIYAIKVSFLWIDSVLNQYFEQFFGLHIPGLGLITILAGITLIGFVGSSFLFRPLALKVDRMISKAPLVKIIYTSVKDLLTAFVGQKKRFNQPVLVNITKDGALQKIGFITNEDLTDLGISEKKIAVYLPHSYAWSGSLFIVPSDSVTKIDASSTEVMKYIISAGVTKI